jgi:anti-sigma regulatory factor (Ser/Thr protein kinase)
MQLFTNVVKNMQVGLHIYRLEDPGDDHTLRLMAANPASITALGLSESELIGRYIDDAVPGLREQGIPQRFADVVRTGVPFSVADFVYFHMGSTPLHVSFSAICLPDNQVGVLVEDITDIVQAEEDKRRFYRKTIEAATEGKLIICDREEIEQTAGPPIATYDITCGEDVGTVRHLIAEIAESEGMDDSRVFDLILCSGEAATNAIKHANGGKVSVHQRDGALLVMVTDNGPGMQAINLPDVALKRGYTTAVSLGMGYKAIISVADQVYLATGPDGTIVAIEMNLHLVEKLRIFPDLPDTWMS